MSESNMAEVLIQLGDEIRPFIEFAEGQKALLLERGWSTNAAEQMATVMLVGLTRLLIAKAS